MGTGFSVDEVFFKTWSHPMAYILGFLYADGSLEYSEKNRGKYVRISSTDYLHLVLIKNTLNSKHTLVKTQSGFGNNKSAWLLRIGNSRLYNSLVTCGLTPKKSLTMSMPKIPRVYVNSFVRGYFDGDGCVYIEKTTTTKGVIVPKRLRVIFTSGSKQFLEDLNNTLVEIYPTLKEGKLYFSSRAHRLVFSTSNSILLYCIMYGHAEKNLLIQDKFDKFNEYFDLRPNKLNGHINRIRA